MRLIMEKYLLNEAYKFFPKKIFGLDEDYVNQIEISRLRKCLELSIDIEYVKWCEILNQFSKKKYNIIDYTNFLLSQPSLHLKVVLEEDNHFLKTLNIYSSLIIPYYYFSIKISDNIENSNRVVSINDFKVLDNELLELINEISKQLNKKVIEKKYLGILIPNISFENIEDGSFTVMNAFFNSNNNL